MKSLRILFVLGLAGPLAAQAGGLVPDRTTLDAITGSLGVTETFESYNLAAGTALTFTGINVFDSTVPLNGQGPGLVDPGVTFSGSLLQWDAATYFGAPTKEILFNSSTITIDFAVPTIAFGVDVRDFAGYSDMMSAAIYAADGTTLLATFSGGSAVALGGGTPVFFGYQDSSGIGRVTLTMQASPWSPLIDNLQFIPVPEPSTGVLLGAGLAWPLLAVRRRAKRRTLES